MKQLVFLAAILFATGALAQDKPTPEATSKPEPAKEAAKPAATKSAATARKPAPRRWNEDARHCLERPSNTEVIKCAEEYL